MERQRRSSTNSNQRVNQSTFSLKGNISNPKNRRKRFYLKSFSLQNLKLIFSSDNKKKRRIITAVSVFLIFILLFIVNTYKNNNFRLNELQYISTDMISPTISKYLDDHSYFTASPRALENEIKKQHPLIKDVEINKTLFKGLVIEIKEYNPIAAVKIGKTKDLYYVKEDKYIPYKPISKSTITLFFTGNEDKLDISSRFIEKATTFIKEVNSKNIIGKYTFDNFGNLTIETIDKRIIKADLSERDHSIDEQVKVFQNALVINTFREIDLRFKNLVINK